MKMFPSIRLCVGIGLCTLVSVSAVATETHADETNDRSSFTAFSFGMTDILDSHPQTGGFIEFRPFWRWRGFGTWAGLGLGKDREYYAALGILYELLLSRQWAVTASFGGGYYVCNDGIDLGSELEFRSSIEACYRTQNDYRLGVGFSHLSNGGISEINPGMETLYLMIGVPFR